MIRSSRSDPLATIQACRVLPVVSIASERHAEGLGRALHAGGLPIAEIVLRTDSAISAITMLSGIGGLCVGAGTVINAQQVDQAVDAGAQFIVSPGLSPTVIARCQHRGIPVIPGVATSTDVITALDAGVSLVKFFPASALGGVAALTALAAPFGGVRFIPTGGITAATAAEYLRHPAVLAVGGTWIAPEASITQQRWEAITARAADAVSLARLGVAASAGPLRGNLS